MRWNLGTLPALIPLTRLMLPSSARRVLESAHGQHRNDKR
jgi:hypothetical protein